MLFGLFRELVDRFIEFILGMVKGETPEAQLTSALKACVFTIAGLLALTTAVLGKNWDLHVQFKEYETAISKLGFLLKAENMKNSSSEIEKLMVSIDRNTNAIRQDNVRLSGMNIGLATENNMLHVVLGNQLQEIVRLRKNNDLLQHMCVFRPGVLMN